MTAAGELELPSFPPRIDVPSAGKGAGKHGAIGGRTFALRRTDSRNGMWLVGNDLERSDAPARMSERAMLGRS